MEELQRRRQRVGAELAEVGRSMKRARRRAASSGAAASRAWELAGSLLHVVLIVHTLADGVVDPSVVFLKRKGREHHWADRSEEELADLVYTAYAHADIDDIVALIDMDNPTDEAALSAAVSYVEQWRVVVWTQAQNRLGVAPSTGAVIDQFEERRASLPASVRPTPWGSSASATSRRRVSRWRRRWHGRIAKLRVREEVPVEVMREKAGREPGRRRRRRCRRHRRRRSTPLSRPRPKILPDSRPPPRSTATSTLRASAVIFHRWSGQFSSPDSRLGFTTGFQASLAKLVATL